MLSLFRFLQRHIFIVYFVVLEVISFIFILDNNPYQRSAFLNSSDHLFGNVLLMADKVDSYLNLRQVNDYLIEENSELKSRDIGFYQKSFDDNIIYVDSSYEQVFTFFPAKIINNSTNNRNNFITLNRGSLNGIEPGMGVISNSGVIGIVIQTSKRYSVVMSILNKESKVSAKVAKNGYFGSVIWEGWDHRIGKLIDVPNHVSLVEGDKIVTSGFSSIFPENVPVGQVKTVERMAGSGFLEVEIIFSEDYQTSQYVHVVKHLYKMEQKELESKVEENDR